MPGSIKSKQKKIDSNKTEEKIFTDSINKAHEQTNRSLTIVSFGKINSNIFPPIDNKICFKVQEENDVDDGMNEIMKNK